MSYVTVSEANALVTNNYMSSDPARARWEAISDADKTVLLNRAHQRIENLPFHGRKTVISQSNAFPRNGDVAVPDKVKLAEVNEAMYDPIVTGATNYKIQGLTSYTIGQFSETFAKGVSDPNNVLNYVHNITRNMLSEYLLGGYNIC
jgi:hypothetical protein